ncbi:hypothetical protein ABT095_08805 [Kitasatospora sp. NPDC002227]|uniref:hypothetical protein n=1 Tax=Kitasatospora sp. NPDC002227 TaxID=3154773 RepID=UPI00332EB296
MDDLRFALTSPQRWRLRLGLYLPPLVLCLPFLPDHLPVGLVAASAWIPVGLYVADLIHGSSWLTGQGLESRSPLRRRRVIPWTDIVTVTSRTYQGRFSSSTVALVHTVSRRRPRRVPGLICHTLAESAEFERALQAIRVRQRRMVRLARRNLR